MKIHDIIIKPILTEKASQMTQSNVYAFEVNNKANKNQVADFLEKLFKVKIAKVRMIKRKGKIKKAGQKMKEKKMSDRKIAYVTLKSGKIDIFPQA